MVNCISQDIFYLKNIYCNAQVCQRLHILGARWGRTSCIIVSSKLHLYGFTNLLLNYHILFRDLFNNYVTQSSRRLISHAQPLLTYSAD